MINLYEENTGVSFCLFPSCFLADKFEMPKFAKVHNSGKI